MAIATTAEYKTYAGISGTAQDAQLNVLLPAIQADIEQYTGRLFDTATFTEYLDGTGTAELMVKNPPIASITSIKIFRTVNDTPTAVDSTLYTFNGDDSGIIKYQPSSFARRAPYTFRDTDGAVFTTEPNWPEGFRNIQVVYVGGYGSSPAAATMPLDLKLNFYKMVSIELEQIGKDITLTSEDLGSYRYQRNNPEALAQIMKDLFGPHKGRRASL